MHTEVYKYMNTDISKLGDVAPGYSCREAAQMDTWPKLCLHKLKHVWFWETQRRQEGRQRHSAGQVSSRPQLDTLRVNTVTSAGKC